jgi:hypothetical protein
MKIQHVPLEFRHQTWTIVEPFLNAELEHAQGDYTIDQIHMLVTTGQWVLVVAVDDDNQIHGAMTINFVTRPNDRVAFITNVGGKFIINQDTYSQLVTLVRGFGATYIEAAGRKSIVRLLSRFGLTEKYTIVGAKL